MNTQNDTTQTPRPFGYWIKAVDRLMAAEFASVFRSEGVTRRDWRLLNAIDGTVPAGRPLHPAALRGLVERGWIGREKDRWALTDKGRAAKERLSALVDGIRATLTDAVSPEELEVTLATLQKITTAYGWDENTPLPRKRSGHRRGAHGHEGRHREGQGFGRWRGRPFGRRRGFGPGFGPDADDALCAPEHGHGRPHAGRPDGGHPHVGQRAA
ncbi:MAG: MarR family winged helix-turn-helix transcriptional regulator, partial [Microbacterium sp.]